MALTRTGRRPALTADDVVFSYERQMTEGWPNAPVLANVADMEALDDRTVLVRFRQPEAEFLHGLADGHSRIVAPEAVAATGDLLRGPTVGTGPWLAARIGNDGAEYEANPDYYENGFPYLDGLDVQIVDTPEARAPHCVTACWTWTGPPTRASSTLRAHSPTSNQPLTSTPERARN